MTVSSINSSWIYTLGTVFTDTLWQGLIIGFSLLIGTFFLKPGDAKSRYNLAVAAILAMLLWTSYDLFSLIHNALQMAVIQNESNQIPVKEIVALQANKNFGISGHGGSLISEFFSSIYFFLGRYYHFIVPIWLTGIILLCIRLAGGWVFTLRIKNHSVFSLSAQWEKCAVYIIKKLHIGRQVLLKGSFTVTSPLVIGYFKPVILIPATIISSLSYSEMEAILTHELAHIHRHDFIFICIQNIAEIILFYHPAIWMISSS